MPEKGGSEVGYGRRSRNRLITSQNVTAPKRKELFYEGVDLHLAHKIVSFKRKLPHFFVVL